MNNASPTFNIMLKDFHYYSPRSFFALCMLFFTGMTAHGQTYIVNEGFEGSEFPPNGWTVIDNDKDGHCWQLATKSDATTDGQQTAISYTVNPENPSDVYGEQDNWLITPQIKVTNETFMLSFDYCAQDLESVEEIEVRVSETGTNPEDFTTVLYSEKIDNGYDDYVSMQSLSRSLADFNGKSIYIAFVHKGYNSYALGIDDVTITNQKGPKQVSGLKVTPGAEGAKSATIEWTNPSSDGTGSPITGQLAIGIYRDYKLLTAISDGIEPGSKSTYTDNAVTQGTHTYSIIAKTAEGESKAVSRSVYIGEDVPNEIEDLTASTVNGKTIISWTAPTEGLNDGYINPANITYTVARVTADATDTIAKGIKELSYTDNDVTEGVLHSYTVTPVNAAGSGVAATSNAVVSYGSELKDITAGPNATSAYGNPYLPFDFSERNGAYQAIFYPADLMYAKGKVKDIVLKNSFSSNSLKKPIKIWMTTTDKESLADGWMPVSDMTMVYDDTLTLTTGDNDVPIELSTPFDYTGGNLVVAMQMDYTIGTGGYFDRFYIEETPEHPDRTRTYGSYDVIDFANLTASTGDLESAIPMTRFVMDATEVATVNGIIKDKATDKPISGATIAIEKYGLATVTDSTGAYSFYIVPSGSQHVKITATGYIDYESDIEIQDGGTQTTDFAIDAMPTVTFKGKITANDTGKPIAGATVKATGYSEVSTTSDADGSFTLNGVYEGEDYTLRIEQPLYDVYTATPATDADLDLGTITLKRSLISAYGVEATVNEDGSEATITWKDPLSRTGRIGWTHWGESDINDDTSGDYSASNFNVAHAFTAEDTEDSMMVGQSFLKLKVYIKATEGTYTATIWKGTRDDNTVLASKVIPADMISADGGWVTVDFDAPYVEIKPGVDYMVGVACQGGSSDVIGVAGYGSDIDGKNNLKWSDDYPYTYDGYYAWNISAYCGIPGTELPVTTDTDAPACTYNVYRTEAVEGAKATKLNAEPLKELTFTDSNWDRLTAGKYMYTVTAVYNQTDEADAALSDTVVRSVNVDAGVTAFISPVKTQDPQNSVEVKVRIMNFGEKPLTSVPVFFTVNDGEAVGDTCEISLNKGDTAEISLGTYALEDYGMYTFKAYTAVEGDESKANDAETFALPNYPDVNLKGYRWDAYGNSGIMSMHSNIPEQAQFLKEVTPDDALINAGEYYNGRVYAFTATWYSEPRQFVVLDTITWAPVVTKATEDFIQDMAYDYSTATMYGLRISSDNSELVTVDLENGATTLVGSTGTSLHAMACSTDGTLYGMTTDGDLCTIDKENGAITVIGSTGITDVAYLQSMAFDHNTGRLFWAHSGNETQGELFEVDPATASVTQLGTTMFEGYPSEIVCLYVPYTHVVDGITSTGSETGNLTVMSAGEGNLRVAMPLKAGETATLRIINMAGITVATANVNSQSALVNANLQSGIYVAVATTSAGNTLKSKAFTVE